MCCDSSPVVDDDVFIGAGEGVAEGGLSSDDLVARVVVNTLEDELAEGFLLAAEDEKPVAGTPDVPTGRAVGREVDESFPRVCEAENPVALGYGGVGDGIIEEQVAGGGADSQGAGHFLEGRAVPEAQIQFLVQSVRDLVEQKLFDVPRSAPRDDGVHKGCVEADGAGCETAAAETLSHFVAERDFPAVLQREGAETGVGVVQQILAGDKDFIMRWELKGLQGSVGV